MDSAGLLFIGLLIVVGLAGVVVPVLPGLLLVWAAVLVWTLFEQTPTAWVLLVIVTLVAATSQAVKFLVPHRRLRDAGVPSRALMLGALLGMIGFFVVPVVGLFIGFVLGVYVYERARLGSHPAAKTASLHALKATGLSILIELLAGLLIAAGWLTAVLLG